ncbi:hypothetical protein Wildcat_46 [Mycobacterium phage Wildcat]|uniref:Minor tail protein n=2 Tax=Mycobacterium virus Wildcat TaxID=1993859 RepID=Q19Y14_9CAUD|nr:hypothetical protein Wildcat_46 [Mycobacterium phage Wildcat]ABE67651.1 hypothetical protein Wildcat_46 [Mycobacterium phage Wildcat]QGJ89936.1 hypothetical protein PBI_MARYV_46 [Mycobacterium phage MaryV]
MANALYDKGREKFLTGDIDWLNDNIKAYLIDVADYTVDLANDEFLDDIPSGAIVATSINLTSKTATSGVADAENVVFTLVEGDQSEAVVLAKDTGTAGTSPLIAYIDNATGLPVTPNGGDITVVWDNGGNKIFKL